MIYFISQRAQALYFTICVKQIISHRAASEIFHRLHNNGREFIVNKYDKNNAEIGARIKETRLKRNMTQETLSEKAEICNPQQISNIERGLSGVSVAKLKDICISLDISTDYILFGTTSRSAETAVSKYIKAMTDEQAANFLELTKAYAKTCGISE